MSAEAKGTGENIWKSKKFSHFEQLTIEIILLNC